MIARMSANQAEMLACPEEMEANVSSEETECYEFGSYPGSNRSRSGAAGTPRKEINAVITGHRRAGAKIDA
jgi:hypothetical protein